MVSLWRRMEANGDSEQMDWAKSLWAFSRLKTWFSKSTVLRFSGVSNSGKAGPGLVEVIGAEMVISWEEKGCV